MHIPDNFLSTPVWATLDAIAIPAAAIVSKKAQQQTDSNRLPLLGVMGAFVFAAQMINFPVGVGTSGHLVGGTLLACLLGPWAASLVMTAILIVQALVFQDGGVLALGANCINMALVGVLAGYLPASLFFDTRWKAYGVFAGGVCSVMVSGTLALAELALSGIRMSGTLVEISLGLFLVNAIVEGAITASVLSAIERLNPQAARAAAGAIGIDTSAARVWRKAMLAFGLAALALTAFGVLVASTLPDGLEHVANVLRLPFGAHPIFRSPLRSYEIRSLGGNWASRAGAGLLGLILIYIVCAIGGQLVGRARRPYSRPIHS